MPESRTDFRRAKAQDQLQLPEENLAANCEAVDARLADIGHLPPRLGSRIKDVSDTDPEASASSEDRRIILEVRDTVSGAGTAKEKRSKVVASKGRTRERKTRGEQLYRSFHVVDPNVQISEGFVHMIP